VGLETLAVAVHEEKDTIEDVYEPYLIQSGFLDRTPRGRKITPLVQKYLGKELPDSFQERLI
jgi:Holliday junction DNA helicase RuvB